MQEMELRVELLERKKARFLRELETHSICK